jgi:TonB family protein
MRKFTAYPVGLLAVAIATSTLGMVGCGGSGMGKAVRKDIVGQMESAKPALSDCYKQALTRDRKSTGTVVVRFKVAADSGQFQNAEVADSSVSDPELEQCVLTKVSALKLAKPQKTVVGVDSYPIRFTPND